MKQRVILAAVMAAMLAACSSGVKLDDVPVEDRNAVTVVPGGGVGSTTPGGQAGQSQVPQVRVDPLAGSQAGPAEVARIIYFDYDSYAIKDSYASLISAHAKVLAANPKLKMLIQGNTDERGSREYNLALGQRRAEAVKRALMLLGVQEVQIESVSLGEEKPRMEGSDEAAYAENRRSEMLYSGEF